jgi:ubiquinone/menaquinone biosynthesis C-methylase UbiE
VAAERSGFYTRTLESLLARGVLDRSMSVLVVAGGSGDRDVLRSLGFGDVTISNLEEHAVDVEPYGWERQDAEALSHGEAAFDWAVVSAGLHHCRSPHRALLELYRVARRGLLALEARDSALMRCALRLGLVDEYELTAVADHGFRSGGVRNTPVPNYVYRWTEREVEKTIASAAPHARDEFLWFHELELPLSIFEVDGARRRLGRVLRAVEPAARAVARVAPGQANLFAFAVVKTGALQPWIRAGAEGPLPDEAEIRRRLGA